MRQTRKVRGDRQTEKPEKQTERQTERQTDTHTHTQRPKAETDWEESLRDKLGGMLRYIHTHTQFIQILM